MKQIVFFIFINISLYSIGQTCDSLELSQFVGKKISKLDYYLDSKGIIIDECLLLEQRQGLGRDVVYAYSDSVKIQIYLASTVNVSNGDVSKNLKNNCLKVRKIRRKKIVEINCL